MADDPIQEEQGRIARAFDAIGELFASRGEKFEDEDAQRLQEAPPSTPGFPFMIAGVSLLKDVLDWPFDVSLVFAIVAWLLSVLMGLILTFWTFGKISGGWWKKSLIRWLWMRFFIMLGLELIPFVNMIPANTIFVLMAHYKEKKIVKLFDEALEILHAGGGGRKGVTVTRAFQDGLEERRKRAATPASQRFESMQALRQQQLDRGRAGQGPAEDAP